LNGFCHWKFLPRIQISIFSEKLENLVDFTQERHIYPKRSQLFLSKKLSPQEQITFQKMMYHFAFPNSFTIRLCGQGHKS
jgi:hypothetical protein